MKQYATIAILTVWVYNVENKFCHNAKLANTTDEGVKHEN